MAKKYLLDTNICVFFMRGKFEMNRKIGLVGINNCYLSEITVAELYFGAENSDNPKKTMIALQHKMVMVTDNIDHLGRIRGIEIENWKTDEPKLQ